MLWKSTFSFVTVRANAHEEWYFCLQDNEDILKILAIVELNRTLQLNILFFANSKMELENVLDA